MADGKQSLKVIYAINQGKKQIIPFIFHPYLFFGGCLEEDHFYTQPNEVNYQINSFKLTTK